MSQGLITTDHGTTWMEPTGAYPDPREETKGQSIVVFDSDAYPMQGFPNEQAGNYGVRGTLFGWIGSGNRAIDNAFFIGTHNTREIRRNESGFVYIAANQTKGKYGNNSGEFEVFIELSHER